MAAGHPEGAKPKGRPQQDALSNPSYITFSTLNPHITNKRGLTRKSQQAFQLIHTKTKFKANKL